MAELSAISGEKTVLVENIPTKTASGGIEEIPAKARKLSSSITSPEQQKADVGERQRSTRTTESVTTKCKPTNTNICGASVKQDNGTRLPFSFYDKPCVELAKALLGKRLVRIVDSGEKLCGRIVETEAYLGDDDKASHSYGGKETAKNGAMFMQAGTAYVYNIYGVYTCLNISSKGKIY